MSVSTLILNVDACFNSASQSWAEFETVSYKLYTLTLTMTINLDLDYDILSSGGGQVST